MIARIYVRQIFGARAFSYQLWLGVAKRLSWVWGDVRTNDVQGCGAYSNRSIVGTFHKISKNHMGPYLEEPEWRFNSRDNPRIFRDTPVWIVNTNPMTTDS